MEIARRVGVKRQVELIFPAEFEPRPAERIIAALRAGQSVILDAVFARAEERAALAGLAQRRGVPLAGLWLWADRDTLVARVTARRGDASDADADVVRRQLASDADADATGWTRIEAQDDPEAVLDRARAALGL